MENCDNMPPQPAAHEFGLNFSIKEFQVVHTSLLTICLA